MRDASVNPGATERGRILIVEDDPALRMLLAEQCQVGGHEVTSVGTGREALALVRDHPPDLVLLDWGLPDLPGPAVCAALRRSGATLPVVMLTARGSTDDVVAGLTGGADDYLVKPVQGDVLRARIEVQLRRRAAPSDPAPDPAAILEKVAVLERVAVLFLEPRAALRRLALGSLAQTAKPGEVVIAQGAANDSLWVVRSGLFRVELQSRAGDTVPIAVLGPYDFFGAASLHSGGPAAASVVAAEPGELLRLPRAALEREATEGATQLSGLAQVAAQRARAVATVGGRGSLRPAGRRGRLTAIYSPKGGVGKTTVALNLAALLAQRSPGDTVLFDLALPYNHAALLGGLLPSTSIARLGASAFEDLVQSAFVHHACGLLILSSVLLPEEADLVTPALVNRTLDGLRREFGQTVVDLSPALSEASLSVLEKADDVILVATPEMSAVKDLVAVTRILQEVLKVPLSRIHLVLNHTTASAAYSRANLERVLRQSAVAEVRNEGSRIETAFLNGVIPALSEKSPMGRSLEPLLRLLAGPA